MPYSNITLDREQAPSVDDDRPSRESSDREAGLEARQLAHEIVARFVRNPAAFAETVRADDPAAFLQDYRQGLDRRLTAIVGAPTRTTDRLATLGAAVVDAPADWLPKTRDDGGVEQPDLSPRMGPVVVVAAVVSAVSAAVSAVVAVVTIATALSKHKPL